MSWTVKRALVVCALIGMSVVAYRLWGFTRESFIWHRDYEFVRAASNGDIAGMEFYRILGADVRRDTPGRGPAIVAAGWSGRVAALRYLIDHGADINQEDKFGWTALIAASSEGKLDAVRFLVSRNADINMSSWDGSALHLAREKRRNDVVAFLGEHGAQDYPRYIPRATQPGQSASR